MENVPVPAFNDPKVPVDVPPVLAKPMPAEGIGFEFASFNTAVTVTKLPELTVELEIEKELCAKDGAPASTVTETVGVKVEPFAEIEIVCAVPAVIPL